jgi:hypothetical protein
MNTCHLDRRGRVRLEHVVDLPLPAWAAWDELADVERFACLELFHRSLWIEGGRPRARAAIRLRHGVPGLAFDRCGRILRWQPGRGWSFSDLSRRGPRLGFPHVFDVGLTPTGPGSCRLVLRITGLWTLRILPRPLALVWLVVIFLKIALGFDLELLRASTCSPPTRTSGKPRKDPIGYGASGRRRPWRPAGRRPESLLAPAAHHRQLD